MSVDPSAAATTATPTSAADQPPTGQTLQLHRVLRASPEKVYRAFLNPEALAKWLPPYGFTCHVDTLTAEVGGRFRMAFTNFSTAHRHAFQGEYLELQPNRLIHYTDRFDDPGLPGTLHTRVQLEAVFCGTELHLTQQGVPMEIPLQACLLGWQESLAQLALLVEPAVPD